MQSNSEIANLKNIAVIIVWWIDVLIFLNFLRYLLPESLQSDFPESQSIAHD